MQHPLYEEKRFSSERNFDAVAYYDKDVNRPDDIINVCKVLDEIVTRPGILSHQQIASLMKLGILIYEGDVRRVKGASFDLLIDKEHLKSGKEVVSLSSFTIDPLDYIIAAARESANLPRNICGTFDTKVSMFCKGIILSNGPQVDPGYQGRLLCLLFNTSAKPVEIDQARDFEFATIQFSGLSRSSEIVYSGRYQRKRQVKDYIGQFADQSMADLVRSIPTINKSLDQIIEKQDMLGKEIGSIDEENRNINSEISELKGRTPKRYSISTLIFTAIFSFFIPLLGAFYYVGGLKEQIGTFQKTIDAQQARIDQFDASIRTLNAEVSLLINEKMKSTLGKRESGVGGIGAAVTGNAKKYQKGGMKSAPP